MEDETVDASGRTAQEFLSELFEFELCPECGKDKEDHTAVIGPFGLWFAYCDTKKCTVCGLPFIRDDENSVCSECGDAE